MKYVVRSVLWRRWNRAAFDTLHGRSRGQYDIRLRSSFDRMTDFLTGLPRADQTDLGGFTVTLPIAPFDGPNPVPTTYIDIHFMGDRSVRRDWIIPSQRPTTAYPLWRPGRGVPDEYANELREFIILIRDTDGDFHARWIHDQDLDKLPDAIRQALLSTEVGVIDLP